MLGAKRKSVPSEQEFQEFYGQTLPIRLEFVARGAGDTGLTLAEMAGDLVAVQMAKRERRLNAHFAKLRAHVVYEYLSTNANMAVALQRFRDLAAKAGSAGYGRPHGEWHFIGEVAMLVGVHTYNPNFIPKSAALRQVERAGKHAVALVAAMRDHNIRLPHWTDQNALEKLLFELVGVLAPQIGERTRKPRADQASSQRYYLDGIIGRLISEFGTAPPALVADVAAVLGLEPDSATIERRIQAVKKEPRRRRPLVLPQLSPESAT